MRLLQTSFKNQHLMDSDIIKTSTTATTPSTSMSDAGAAHQIDTASLGGGADESEPA